MLYFKSLIVEFQAAGNSVRVAFRKTISMINSPAMIIFELEYEPGKSVQTNMPRVL